MILSACIFPPPFPLQYELTPPAKSPHRPSPHPPHPKKVHPRRSLRRRRPHKAHPFGRELANLKPRHPRSPLHLLPPPPTPLPPPHFPPKILDLRIPQCPLKTLERLLHIHRDRVPPRRLRGYEPLHLRGPDIPENYCFTREVPAFRAAGGRGSKDCREGDVD